MKVGVLGDVHCHAPNLEAALGFFASEQVSRVVCTGDVVDGEPDVNHLVNDAIRLLRDERVATVRGNHDVWLLEDAPGLSLPSPEQPIDRDGLDWLRELPPTLSFAMGSLRVHLCHGCGEDDMFFLTSRTPVEAIAEYVDLNSHDLVICGHTHGFEVWRARDTIILNAGAVADCASVLDLERREVRVLVMHDGSERCFPLPTSADELHQVLYYWVPEGDTWRGPLARRDHAGSNVRPIATRTSRPPRDPPASFPTLLT
jgi:putative phosphoesterase